MTPGVTSLNKRHETSGLTTPGQVLSWVSSQDPPAIPGQLPGLGNFMDKVADEVHELSAMGTLYGVFSLWRTSRCHFRQRPPLLRCDYSYSPRWKRRFWALGTPSWTWRSRSSQYLETSYLLLAPRDPGFCPSALPTRTLWSTLCQAYGVSHSEHAMDSSLSSPRKNQCEPTKGWEHRLRFGGQFQNSDTQRVSAGFMHE